MDTNKKNREELKSYFRKGAVPTEEHFALLIDSVPNIIDDELDKKLEEEAVEPETSAEPEESNGPEILTIPADGEWHSLPVEGAARQGIAGCRIYQIYASYYDKRNYEYAMCEAKASHRSGKDREITSPQSHWWGWSGEIKIRWYHKDGQLYLQMRSKGNKKGVDGIKYRIAELWNFTDSV
jgi:hypothetical protein